MRRLMGEGQPIKVPGVYTVTLTVSGLGGGDTQTRAGYISVTWPMVSRVITYTYDHLYRLTGADYSTGETFAYAYDAVGNRTVQTRTITSTTVTTYTYPSTALRAGDSANRLDYYYEDGAQTDLAWDANGNLLTQGTSVYTWDAANRLVSADVDGVVSTYAYDGLGQRTSQTVGGVTTEYVLDVAGGLPEVIVATTGGASTYYVQIQGQILAQHGSGAWAYALPDHLGSVRQLTNAGGQVTLAQGYDPFGVLFETAGSGASAFGYTGEWYGGYNELLYLRARYYDPATGRFASKDPWLGNELRPQSMNGWSYVENNSINLTDPSGKYVGPIDGYVEGMQVGVAIPVTWLIDRIMRCPDWSRVIPVRHHISILASELVYDFHHLQSAIFDVSYRRGADLSSDRTIEVYFAKYAGPIIGLAEWKNIDGYQQGTTYSYGLGGSTQVHRFSVGLGASLSTNVQDVSDTEGVKRLLKDAFSKENNIQVTSLTFGLSVGGSAAGRGFSTGGKAKGTGSFSVAVTARVGPILYYEVTEEDRNSLRPVNAMALDIGTGARFEAMRQGQADFWGYWRSLGNLAQSMNPLFWITNPTYLSQRTSAVGNLYGYHASRWSPW
jgi:RHS repeat-associated protein